MRLSCNGCRVLRKGCTDHCTIRPCLDWIQCPYSQANATVFLVKFYGRAGLMNLINAAPANLRPAVFRSLLYEACGRIVNPIYGSVGLLWSGSWQLCHDAVEAVLTGAPITPMTADAAETKNGPPLKAYDIRHVNKDDNNLSGSGELRRVRNRKRFKRVGPKSKRARGTADGSASHESSLSHQSEPSLERESPDGYGLASGEPEIELDLTLGFEPFKRCVEKPKRAGSADDEAGLYRMKLGLDYSTADRWTAQITVSFIFLFLCSFWWCNKLYWWLILFLAHPFNVED